MHAKVMEIKRAICLVFVIIALLVANVLPGYAQRHGHGRGHAHGHFFFRGGVWIGPGWGGWDPWWWGPPAYPYYYWEPPFVMQEQPPVYVEPTPQPEEEYYWYFCPDSKNYYPYVKQCPSGWLRVVPPQAPPDWRE